MNLTLLTKSITKINLQQRLYLWLGAPLVLVILLVGYRFMRPQPATVSVVHAVPTYTPTPGAVKAASVPVTTTAATPILVPTGTPTVTPTPSATPKPAERLAEGLRLHRYGNYAAAREQFAALLAEPSVDLATKLQGRYALARAYMAENSYTEVITVLDALDKDLVENPQAKDQFQSKELFLRAEAQTGLGQPSQAIA